MKKQKVIRKRMWGVFFDGKCEAAFDNKEDAVAEDLRRFYPDRVLPVIVEWKEPSK